MTDLASPILSGSLVLYRGKPARVARAGERLELELETPAGGDVDGLGNPGGRGDQPG